jgi:hypothetical protein
MVQGTTSVLRWSLSKLKRAHLSRGRDAGYDCEVMAQQHQTFYTLTYLTLKTRKSDPLIQLPHILPAFEIKSELASSEQ